MVTKCGFCNFLDDAHDKRCPGIVQDVARKELAMRAWRSGFRDGRDGSNKVELDNPFYLLGYSVAETLRVYLEQEERRRARSDKDKVLDSDKDEDEDDGLGKRCVDPLKLLRARQKRDAEQKQKKRASKPR